MTQRTHVQCGKYSIEAYNVISSGFFLFPTERQSLIPVRRNHIPMVNRSVFHSQLQTRIFILNRVALTYCQIRERKKTRNRFRGKTHM